MSIMETRLTKAFRILINEPYQVICRSQVQITEVVFNLQFEEPGKMQLRNRSRTRHSKNQVEYYKNITMHYLDYHFQKAKSNNL